MVAPSASNEQKSRLEKSAEKTSAAWRILRVIKPPGLRACKCAGVFARILQSKAAGRACKGNATVTFENRVE
jgi:hypothetical protein